MVVETREERIARGHPVGKPVPYAAMGGLTGFSSLIDGYLRLDDSGVGAPPLEWLESSDGPLQAPRPKQATARRRISSKEPLPRQLPCVLGKAASRP